MADAKLSATVPHAHVSSSGEPGSAHPLAGPGYGKRSAPGQLRRTAHDFAGLPAREAAIAGYLDRLPDGSDISVKTLAKVLPYGQCALGTALNRLQKAGYLRRGREVLVNAEGGSRWITRSWFSRTARDDDWWAAFTRGDLPEDGIPEEGVPEEGVPEEGIPPVVRRARRSRAHLLLAALGRTTPALSLSEADCAALAPLLTEWFERGASDEAVLKRPDLRSAGTGPSPGGAGPQASHQQAPARAATRARSGVAPAPAADARPGVCELPGARPTGVAARRSLR